MFAFSFQLSKIQILNPKNFIVPIASRYQKFSVHVGHHSRVHELRCEMAPVTPCLLLAAPTQFQSQPQQVVELHYETHDVKFLHHHNFILRDAEGDIVVELPLYELALLPMLHFHRLPHQADASLTFVVNMEQISDIKITIPRLQLNLFQPLNCFLKYGLVDAHSQAPAAVFETGISVGNINPLFTPAQGDHRSIQLTCSLRELLSKALRIQLVAVHGNAPIPYGEFVIPLINTLVTAVPIPGISPQRAAMLASSGVQNCGSSFEGDISISNQPVSRINGMLEIEHLPMFAHVQGHSIAYLGCNAIVGKSHKFLPFLLSPNVSEYATEQEALNASAYKDAEEAEKEAEMIREAEALEQHAGPIVLNANAPETLQFSDFSVTYTSQQEGLVSSIRATHPISALKHKYFEIRVEGSGSQCDLCIGLAPKTLSHQSYPGATNKSYGYRSINGLKYHAYSAQEQNLRPLFAPGSLYGPTFTLGDVIGCGVNDKTGGIYFTKNGRMLGYAFFIKSKKPEIDARLLFPTLSLQSRLVKVSCNFGSREFAFTDFAQTDLPDGWSVDFDNLHAERYFFKRSEEREEDGEQQAESGAINTTSSFVDPRLAVAQPSWFKYISAHTSLVNALSSAISLIPKKPSNQGHQARLWSEMDARVLAAVQQIPRAAFVPEELLQSHDKSLIDGSSIHAKVSNGTKIDVTSTWVTMRALSALGLKPGHRVLTLGSSTGYATVLAGFIVSSDDIPSSSSLGKSIGIEIDANLVQQARDLTRDFVAQRGLQLDNVQFEQRLAYLLPGSEMPLAFDDYYNAVFCQLNLSRQHISDLRGLLRFRLPGLGLAGPRVVTGLEGDLVLLEFDDKSQVIKEELLLKNVAFPDFVPPSSKTIRVQQQLLIKAQVVKMGDISTSLELIDEAMTSLAYHEEQIVQNIRMLERQISAQAAQSPQAAVSGQQMQQQQKVLAMKAAHSNVHLLPMSHKIIAFLSIYHQINDQITMQQKAEQEGLKYAELPPLPVDEVMETLVSWNYQSELCLAYLTSIRQSYLRFREELPGLGEKRIREIYNAVNRQAVVAINALADISTIFAQATDAYHAKGLPNDPASEALLVREIVRTYFYCNSDKDAALKAILSIV